jgi:hypothetical protein
MLSVDVAALEHVHDAAGRADDDGGFFASLSAWL